MEWVETTGRSVEEALDAALDELGVDEDDVEYEVLEQPKAGLFGRLGGNPARIRARVRPLSREKPGERQRRNRRGSRARNGSRSSGASTAGTTPASRSDTEPAEPVRVDTGGDRDEVASAAAAVGTATGGSSSRRRRRGGRGRGRGGSGSGSSGVGAAPAARGTSAATAATMAGVSTPTSNGGGRTGATEPPSAAREGYTMETTDEVSIEEQADIAERFTRGLIDAFDVGATVSVTVDDETILVSIDGPSIGLLVGPRGATLTAIEELVRTVVQRQTDGHGARINVDVGGYRAKRRAALEEFTRSLIDKVLATGRAQSLEPMSSSDRKIVHDTAAAVGGVITESEGEEPRRRVIIRRAPGADGD